ncbi:asialoglycoprotein receptor 2-like [Sebastes fasciatus]|uniref:asialoglycoprotein receptor 2-like n=1 Tax=Sebastes fasciatus TaxID=394691 RepID=UPI003D9E0BD9
MNRKPREDTEEIVEEADYVNEPVCTVEKVAAPPDYRFRFFTQSFPLIAVCWLILLVILGLHIYFTSVISENYTKLTAEIENLTTQIQQLNTSNQGLEAQNQELETQKNNLTEQIQDMETNLNELNVLQGRQCEPCQEGWEYNKPSCYAINNAASSERRTWEAAREDCKGKNADLAVIHDQKEKDLISRHSWGSSGNDGYWIGLRVEDRKWKWIDGTDLTEKSWILAPTVGHCAISFENGGWKSVSCDVRQQWLCKMNASSL